MFEVQPELKAMRVNKRHSGKSSDYSVNKSKSDASLEDEYATI